MTVEEYLAEFTGKPLEVLLRVRETLREAHPEAVELISWQMPTYKGKHNVIHFAGFKGHLGIYPGPDTVSAFADRLTGLKTAKGSIQFPWDKVDYQLIADLAQHSWTLDQQ